MTPTKIQFISDEDNGGSATIEFEAVLNSVSSDSKLASNILSALDRKMMKLKAYRPMDTEASGSSMYLLMLVGFNDIWLENLGRECEMPRGFPIIWYPPSGSSENHLIKFFGFRRKFSNDKRQGTISVEADGAAWFKKVSGF